MKKALLIVNTYENSVKKLHSAKEDLSRMKELLTKFSFLENNIHFCLNDNIEKNLVKFLQQSKENDLLVIYYAGHGGELVGSIYVPKNVGLMSSWIQYDGKYILSYTIDTLLSEIDKNCNIILLSDSCYCGNFLNYYKSKIKNKLLFIGASTSTSKTSEYIWKDKNISGAIVILLEYLNLQNMEELYFKKIGDILKKSDDSIIKIINKHIIIKQFDI